MRVCKFLGKTLLLLLLLGSFFSYSAITHAQPLPALQPQLGSQNTGQYADTPEAG